MVKRIGVVCAVLLVLLSGCKGNEKLYIELNTESIEMKTGDLFIPNLYINAYSDGAKLTVSEFSSEYPGEYEVTYTVSQKKKSVSETLKVIVKSDQSIPPVLLLTEESVTIWQGDDLDLKSYIQSAFDYTGVNLKDKVSISDYDENLENQDIIYSVTDDFGQTTEAKLLLHIKPKEVTRPQENNTSPSENNSSNSNVKPTTPPSSNQQSNNSNSSSNVPETPSVKEQDYLFGTKRSLTTKFQLKQRVVVMAKKVEKGGHAHLLKVKMDMKGII